jgi:hypothetical protein
MICENVMRSARIILPAFVLLGLAATVRADAYYSIIDLGNEQNISTSSSAILNTQTGQSWAFQTTTPAIPQNILTNLPEWTGQYGTTNPTTVTYPMTVVAYNSAGTAIGELPSGQSLALPWSTVVMGYAVRSPDGQWSSFVPLSSSYGPAVELSQQANVILVGDNTGWRLVNPVAGSTTPLTQLVPPSFLQQFSGQSFFGLNIDDRGDILVAGFTATGQEAFLLTPPGLIAPAAVPEPTALATIVVAASAWVLRRRFIGRDRAISSS